MVSYFADVGQIEYKGPDSPAPLSFRHYDKNRLVLGKRMEDHLRFAVCYWHSFSWNGFDPFGYDGTFDRPWHRVADPMEAALLKADTAFDFFDKLGTPFYTFHDRDIVSEGQTPSESLSRFRSMIDVLAGHQERTGIRLLWGTANLFSHRQYMSGAATNPDPEIVAIAAAQVKAAMDATLQLKGENYVLWGGREGYETLLNTNVKQELDQMGRFLNMVVDYKHKIGFKGTIFIEPKPREPTKHQYDFDTASVFGFLAKYKLETEIKVNIEANHATLAGHSFEHEIAMALAFGILGSIDMNRGDPQLGWDTDQFPNNVPDLALAMYTILQGGGLTTGGFNFDAKVRRQSVDPVDLFHGHIGAMDVCARALLVAERMIRDGLLEEFLNDRYAGWSLPMGSKTLAGAVTLESLSDHALGRDLVIVPPSGRQEYLENLVNRYC